MKHYKINKDFYMENKIQREIHANKIISMTSNEMKTKTFIHVDCDLKCAQKGREIFPKHTEIYRKMLPQHVGCH